MKTYSGKDIQLTINGIKVSGFSDSDLFTVSRNSPVFESKTGADGEHTRHRNNDRSGKVKLSLLYSSEANQQLSELLQKDDYDGSGVFNLHIQDQNGKSSASGELCYVTAWPEWGVTKETPVIEWEIAVADLKINLGGL